MCVKNCRYIGQLSKRYGCQYSYPSDLDELFLKKLINELSFLNPSPNVISPMNPSPMVYSL